jgi:hypothetical protein
MIFRNLLSGMHISFKKQGLVKEKFHLVSICPSHVQEAFVEVLYKIGY